MKIAVISTPIFVCPPLGYSGLEMIAWESAKGLAAKGHEVSLVAPDGSSCPNVNIIPIGKPGTMDERNAFKLYGNELPKYQVVIDHSWQKHSYLMKLNGMLQCPVLGVMHAPVNTMYQTLPNVPKPCFVCISQDQANHFNALHSPVSSKVCYNGIDLDLYKPIENLNRTKRFLFLARFSSIKGADIAIHTCRQTGTELDLIGDTSITNEPDYFNTCKHNCDNKQIRMIGPCKRGEAVWWYSQAYAMLHPNMRFREPLGLAPIEAMACGTPVITFNFGAMRETVIHGQTGRLARTVDEYVGYVAQLVSNGVSQSMRRDCRESMQKFSVQRMVNRYEELCVEAVDTGGW